MRTPLLTKSNKRTRVSVTESYMAPVGGWNGRDSLAAMKPSEAVALDNLFPTPSYVETRGGCSSHATGLTGNGKTLAVYNAMSGTNTMYAYTASGIYDVSSAGAVGASKLARTNGKHQWTMFGDGTNNWLIAVNGVDAPAYFDGTTWTAVTGATSPALTGLTTTNIIGVCVFKGRLIFIQKDSLSFWYLAAGAAGGALTEFDLSGEAPKGGYLMACATWTRDAGSGPDDFFVAITSEGEAIVYQGTNPSSATTWAKVGSYTVGKPIGRRCIMQYGAECVVITESGVFPLSSLLMSGEERAKYALSFKIETAFTEIARSYGSTFGWRAITLPERNAMLVNVPVAEDGTHYQYVMNVITKAWCRFTGWDAEDFAVFNKKLYFCDGTVVFKAWDGTSDNTSNIIFYAKQAFQDFGNPNPKQCKLFMPIMIVNGILTYSTAVDVDFEDTNMTSTTTFTPGGTSLWGTALWGSSTWGSASILVKNWTSPASWEGRWLSGKLKIEENSITAKWMGTSMIYEWGASLG
jgi:hypothetical protein